MASMRFNCWWFVDRGKILAKDCIYWIDQGKWKCVEIVTRHLFSCSNQLKKWKFPFSFFLAKYLQPNTLNIWIRLIRFDWRAMLELMDWIDLATSPLIIVFTHTHTLLAVGTILSPLLPLPLALPLRLHPPPQPPRALLSHPRPLHQLLCNISFLPVSLPSTVAAWAMWGV